jgi:hypothetical protein
MQNVALGQLTPYSSLVSPGPGEDTRAHLFLVPFHFSTPPSRRDGWSGPLRDGRQRWREGAICALLAADGADVLFIAGCEENPARFHPQFDHVILLSAPPETLLERLAARTGNSYGKAPGELSRVLHDLESAGALLRRAADHEIRTTMALNEVVSTILRLIGP